MKRLIFTTLFLLLATRVFAQGVSFYIVYPEGEGDPNSAQPYLAEFFDYLKEQTGVPVTGMYINSLTDAENIFKQDNIQLAIVSPEFFEKNSSKFNLTKTLQTIPSYSGGPFERYYIMAGPEVDVLSLMDQQATVKLVASRFYDAPFLNEKIFIENPEMKKLVWQFEQTSNILDTIKQVATGAPNTFLFLTGYEFSVVNGLKKQNKDFAKLRLVFTSRELPSSPLVTVGKVNMEQVEQIKAVLLNMPGSLKGDMILKKLRLKGFAAL